MGSSRCCTNAGRPGGKNGDYGGRWWTTVREVGGLSGRWSTIVREVGGLSGEVVDHPPGSRRTVGVGRGAGHASARCRATPRSRCRGRAS
jgi:hypothetical protein